jgi:ATP-dependent DNA ligase
MVWKALTQVIERGYEGTVAKDEASAYAAGPTKRWLKVKQKAWTIGDERWTCRISVEAR